MSLYFWLILLIVNVLLYGAISMLILKRKQFTCISIRSPILLVLNNLGSFFMLTIIILTKLIPSPTINQYISGLYYLTHIFIIVPFCLRCHRILVCCELKIDERMDLQQFSNKRYLYQEKYYLNILLIVFGILTVLLIISILIETHFSVPFSPNFILAGKSQTQFILWMVIFFLENLILLTYTYKICINELKQKLRFESVTFLIIWLIYSNICTIIDTRELNQEIIIIFTIVVCYICLVLHGILPIIISYSYKYSIAYHFTPKLLNNLYLFLSNETCYKIFSDYLNEINNGKIYLKIYTCIMNYKLGFVLKIETENEFQEARNLYNTYFANNELDAIIGKEVVDKVKNECKTLDNNMCTPEMFDCALLSVFNELGKLFNDFRKTSKYRELYEELYLTSYIQCKMCNTGLLDKF